MVDVPAVASAESEQADAIDVTGSRWVHTTSASG